MRAYIHFRRYESGTAIEAQHAGWMDGGRATVDLAGWFFGRGGISLLVLQIGFGEAGGFKKLL